MQDYLVSRLVPLGAALFVLVAIAVGVMSIQSERVVAQAPTIDNATGTPVFIGAHRVGEVLRVDTSSITDPDGLTNRSFTFEWQADDGMSFTLFVFLALSFYDGYEIAPYNVGLTVSAQIHFRDDLGNDESIEIRATSPVAAVAPDAPGNLSASLGGPGELNLSWSAPQACDHFCWILRDRSVSVGDGGADIFGYTVQWKLSSGDWSVASDVSETQVTSTSYTITGLMAINTYTVRVLARNAAGPGTPSTEVTVSGTDLNVGPVVSGPARPHFFETNSRDVATYTATDPDNATTTWSLSGDDAGFFSIADGVLNFDFAGDFEDPQDVGANNAYNVTIHASDGQNTATVPLTVVIRNDNEPPAITGDDSLTFAEDTATTTVLHAYAGSDPDGVATSLTWSLAGADSGDFDISSTGALRFKNVPDYDRPADSGGDNEYNVQVRAYDGSETGTLDVTVTVTNVNEAPSTPTGRDAIEVAENTTGNLARYSATDPDKDDTVMWDVSGTDASAFRIDSSGNLAFDGAPDYESPTDSGGNNVYEISVDAKDADYTSSLNVTVTVTPVDEPPVITGVTTIDDYDENGSGDVATYTAADPESATSTITWSLGGADSGDFDITSGVLTFKNTPDYERPADSGGNNHYEVKVQATDPNDKRGELQVDVIVTPVDEPPELNGPDTVDDFPENSATSRQVGRYTARDPEGATVTLSLSSGDADFALASNGVLTFKESPDYEERSSYSVTVRAVVGSHTVDKVVTVNIQNVEEPGSATLSTVQPQEGTSLTATLEDDDDSTGTIWQWYRTSSRGSTGTAITNANSRSYTPVEDDVGRYLRAVATYDDGYDTGNSASAVSVNRVQEAPPAPEPPVFPADGDYDRSIRENLSAGRNIGAPVTATDGDNDRLTYTIPASDEFEIVESTGQLRTKAELDREGQDQHFVTVTATDPGGLTDTVTVTITVEDVDETPVVSGPGSLELEEGTSAGTTLATYTSTDPDRKGIDLVLSGTDSEDFTLSSSGVLTFNEVPNFEEPADSNRDNRYQVTVEAREQGDGTSVGRLNVTIRVTNVDERGVLETNVEEPRVGQTVRLNVEDEDGGVNVTEWKWERGDRNGSCGTVDSPTVTTWGTISGARSSSYTPTSADQGHCIRATAFYNDRAGTGRTLQFLTAESVELGPFFESDTGTGRVQENSSENTSVGRFRARHSNSGETLTYGLAGADAGHFTIDDNGQLKTGSIALDYESVTDHEAEVEITATAPDNETATITVTIAVTDECASAGEPPCAPGTPSVSSESDTSLHVTWSTPRTPSGTSVTGYQLQYRESDSGGSWIPQSVAGTDRSHTIENLIKDTTYEVQVRAINDSSGYGEWSQSGTGKPGYVPPPPPIPPITIGGTNTGGGGGGGGGGASADPSLIVFSPSAFSFEAVEGGDNPPPQTLRVWNAQEREMAFGTSENAPWLTRSPSAGISDGPDDAVRITLSVDVSGLEAGSYTASVRVSGRRIGNSPQRVPVTLTVRSPGYARERVSPGERTEIVTPDSTLRLIVPENAASAEVDIEARKLDVDSLSAPPGDQERVILAVQLQTLAPGSETPQPITFSPGAELRLLLPEDEEASCNAGRVRLYRVDDGEWELLNHRCETNEEGRVWAVSILTSFSVFVLTVDDAAYPVGSICWSVSNILSWTTSKTSGSEAAPNTLLVWLEGVLRLWLSLSCR